jgi:MFS family permease
MGASAPSTTLSSRSFRSLLGSALASAVGASISSVAVNWLVYHYTGSTLDVAYVGLAGIVPGIALGLFAGVLADRLDRRRLMVASDLVRMTVMGALALALYLSGFSLLLVLAAVTLVYSFTAVFTPASQAILPRIVATERLEAANGVLSALTQTGYTVGAAAGGLVVVFAGAVAGLGLNAATYAVSGILLFQIAAEAGRVSNRPGRAARSVRQDLGEGLHYMRTHRPILEITLGFLPANFLLTMVTSFLVVYASVVYGGNAVVYGYLVAGLSAGAAAGALAVPRLRARRFAGLLMGVSVTAQGGPVALLIFGRTLALSVAAAVGFGVCIGLINTVYFATMQAVVPNEVLARVLSIDSVGAFVAIPAGLLVGGLLAASHGILFTYAVAGVGIVANGIVLLALPGARSLRYEAGTVPS